MIEKFQTSMKDKGKYLAFYVRSKISMSFDAMTTSPVKSMNSAFTFPSLTSVEHEKFLPKNEKYFLKCYPGTRSTVESVDPLTNLTKASNWEQVPPWHCPPRRHLGTVFPPSLTILDGGKLFF
jgi:hypothetical protein